MDSLTTSIALVGGGILALAVLTRLEKRLLRKRYEQYEKALPRLQRKPDRDWILERFALPLPDQIYQFYVNNPLAIRRNFKLVDPSGKTFTIDHFMPIQRDSIDPHIDEDFSFIPFATDYELGFYWVSIDPRNKFLSVRFFKDDFTELNMSFDEFINLKVAE